MRHKLLDLVHLDKLLRGSCTLSAGIPIDRQEEMVVFGSDLWWGLCYKAYLHQDNASSKFNW